MKIFKVQCKLNYYNTLSTRLIFLPKYRENNLTLEREIVNIGTSTFIISKANSNETVMEIINNRLFEIFSKKNIN